MSKILRVKLDNPTWGCIRQLGDAECGRIFKSMMDFVMTGSAEEPRGNERYVWPLVLEELEADAARRKKQSEVNSKNGAKGGRPQKAKESEKNRMGYFRYNSLFDETQERNREESPPPKEEKKERTKERIEEYTPTQEEKKKEQANNARVRVKNPDGFDEFWKAYPRKVGKGAARNSYARAIAKGVTLETLLDALEKRKQSEQWLRDGGSYIPHPSTWLNQERWEDDLTTEGGITDEQSLHGFGGSYQGNGYKQFDIVYDA